MRGSLEDAAVAILSAYRRCRHERFLALDAVVDDWLASRILTSWQSLLALGARYCIKSPLGLEATIVKEA